MIEENFIAKSDSKDDESEANIFGEDSTDTKIEGR